MLARPNCSDAESLAYQTDSEQLEVLQGLSDEEALAILYDWSFWARPNQLPPAGDWVHWLLLAGRGFGKTKTGAETVRNWARDPLPGPIHLIAPTASDIRNVMIEGPSGILSCYQPGYAPKYEPSRRHRLSWPNGNVAYGFSADEPERLRGPQCCRYWADELAAWRYPEEAWDNLMFGFRLGEDLRGIITTTPKPIKQLKAILADAATRVTRGSTYDNRGNLAKAFFGSIVKKYEGTRLGRQELNAELLEDVPGALWKRIMIDATRIRFAEIQWDKVVRTVVALDPSVSHTADSDECGIIVAALVRSGHALILDDLSVREMALEWAKIAVAAFFSRRADRIVAEVNNGGELVETTLRIVNPNIPYKPVWAKKGKEARAEPVAALYEQGRIHHVGSFGTLEDELCTWVPGSGQPSPNRLDALVWALTDLFGLDGQEDTGEVVVNPAGSYRISPI